MQHAISVEALQYLESQTDARGQETGGHPDAPAPAAAHHRTGVGRRGQGRRQRSQRGPPLNLALPAWSISSAGSASFALPACLDPCRQTADAPKKRLLHLSPVAWMLGVKVKTRPIHICTLSEAGFCRQASGLRPPM